MTLIKTSLLNGIAVAIKMLTLLGLNKILAIYVGPSGYAALGQFQNAVQMITTFASGAINTGVTKYTAEYHSDEEAQHKVWRTAGTIAITGSLLSAVIIVLLNESLAIWFLKDANYGGVFVWFAASLVLFTSNALLLAILNGKKEIVRYIVANIAGSIFALSVTTLMAMRFGLYGALVALAVYQSLTFFVTLFVSYKTSWFRFDSLFGRIDKPTAINLLKYTAMALTSAACVPLSHILVRNHLGLAFGWQAAGYWEAMWRLSSAYLMIVTTTLSLYYLPRLSELKHVDDIKLEVINGYRLILPLAIVCSVFMYVFRDTIIVLLFTADFAPMRELFPWQLLGDTFKIASWILAYLMLGRAMIKLFVVTEILFAVSFVLLVYYFSSFGGIESASIAHAVNYFVYFLILLIIVPMQLRKMRS